MSTFQGSASDRLSFRAAWRMAAVLLLSIASPAALAQEQVGPSAFCHQTDGMFTACPGGGEEWSDITPAFFPETRSYLYADQADLDPILSSPTTPLDTFMLLYDECGRTTPLAPDEYVLVTFDTVEVEDGAASPTPRRSSSSSP